MKKIPLFLLTLCLIPSSIGLGETVQKADIVLPDPSYKGGISVEEAIRSRRTTRDFQPVPLTLSQLSQLLWAAQGITDKGMKFRSAPSAGALYPLDVYIVVGYGGVEGLAEGVYRFLPRRRALRKIAKGDKRGDVAEAALAQNWIAQAPAVFIITAEYRRTMVKYGNRGIRYALIEVGHVGQNIFLQAEALGLGAGIVGAFGDGRLAKAIEARDRHEPLIIMPVGHKK
jgi:SagB-type dehydrogenase family enzyme